MERKIWIDTLKGLSMLAILLFHTEVYYADHDVINYNYYVENALMAFAFASGYLFLKPQQALDIKRKMKSILTKLILPYFAFTIILALGKWLLNSHGYSLGELLLHVVTGVASWYVAALIVAELLFCLILRLTRTNLLLMFIIVFAFFLGVALLSSPQYYALNSQIADYWKWKEAMLLLFFIALGHIYSRHKDKFQFFNRTPSIIFLLVMVCIVKYLEQSNNLQLVVAPVSITYYSVFIFDCAVSILLLIAICRRLPSLSIITYIGKNSLIVYFLCGAVPFIIAATFRRLGLPYNGDYLRIVLVYIFVIDATTITAYLLRRAYKFLRNN